MRDRLAAPQETRISLRSIRATGPLHIMTALDLFPSRDLGPFGRRQKRARGARMPVTIVTGFLGAGKTTLVRRFLTTPEGRATAVIINEYGAVGIDDALVRGTTDEVALLGNG